MKFQFTKLDHLPRLSWCAILQYGEDAVQVFHGPWVETGESLFVEGAWDGDFGEYSFDTSEVFMGLG